MRRTPLRRFGKKGPWRNYSRKYPIRVNHKARPPGEKSRFAFNGDGRYRCEAHELNGGRGCSGPVNVDHIFRRQVRGVGGCDCAMNRCWLCWRHHMLKDGSMGRERFYSQTEALRERLEVAREHWRLRRLPNSPLPCAAKYTRRPC